MRIDELEYLGSCETIEEVHNYCQKELRRRDSIKKGKRHRIHDLIIDVVCQYFEIPSDYLESKDRHREDRVTPRQIYCYWAKHYTKDSLGYIGTFIKKDHATVLHSIRTAKSLYDVDSEYRYHIDTVGRMLKEAKIEDFINELQEPPKARSLN